MSIIGNGSNVLVFDANGAPIACQKNVNVTFNDEVIDVTCKQSNGYSEFLPGKRNFSMTCEALTDWGQNLLLYSEEFDNVAWNKQNAGTGSVPIVTANSVMAPNETLTADTIFFDSGAGTSVTDLSIINQAPSLSINTYTGSIYLKGSVGGEQILFRHVGLANYTLLTLTTEWVRYELTQVYSGDNFEFGIRQGTNIGTINSTATIYAWGAQLNTGTTAQSYYQTTSTVNPNIDTLVSANLNRTKIELNIANPAFDDIYFNGEAYVESIEQNAGTEDVASYTVTFSGTGDLVSLVS